MESYGDGCYDIQDIDEDCEGTFSHNAVKSTIEFEMADVYLAEDYDSDYHEHWINGEMPYHTKCIKQFVIPNMFSALIHLYKVPTSDGVLFD